MQAIRLGCEQEKTRTNTYRWSVNPITHLGCVFALALLLIGCEGDMGSGQCSAASCAGCCYQEQCVAGTAPQACGKNGAVCTQCPAGQSCQWGECSTDASCTMGCLDSTNTCQPGNTVQSCGTGGKTCVVCTNGETCANGACQKGCNYITCPEGCCADNQCHTEGTAQYCGKLGGPCLVCQSDQSCTSGQCIVQGQGCDGCNGCCKDNVCFPGNTNATCGHDGKACMECRSSDYCHEGTCKANTTQCDSTCDGCCNALGLCINVLQQDESACGKGGEICNVCSSTATCQQGTCVEDQPCFSYCTKGCCTNQGQCVGYDTQSNSSCGTQGNICDACGSGLSCLEGKCVNDPVWEVWVISAVVEATTSEGSAWDWIGTAEPDCYAAVGLNDWYPKAFSKSIDNTVTPFFDQKVTILMESELLTHKLYVDIYDDDWLGYPNDDYIGSCAYQATTLSSGTTITMTDCYAQVKEITIKFVKQ